MSKFLIKYATRGRPRLFMKAIHNIKNTIQTKDYQVLISADVDDKTMNNKQVQKYVNQTKNLKIVYGHSTSKIHAINRDMQNVEPWGILVNMSDDMVFKIRGWDQKIINHSRAVWGDSLDWFGHWSDGYVGAALSTMSIMGRTYYERDNYIYHPSYKSFSSDAEAYYVAVARGCHHYFPEVLFKHELHPAYSKKNKNDAVYKKNSHFTEHDTKNYFERLNNDFYLNLPGPFPWDQYKTV
jgi:hypothetical protein